MQVVAAQGTVVAVVALTFVQQVVAQQSDLVTCQRLVLIDAQITGGQRTVPDAEVEHVTLEARAFTEQTQQVVA